MPQLNGSTCFEAGGRLGGERVLGASEVSSSVERVQADGSKTEAYVAYGQEVDDPSINTYPSLR